MALLITEIMGSFLMLFFYEGTKKNVLQYIVPIWEVTGTFGAFWVVSSYFIFPALLIPIAEMFAGLLIVFLIFFVARNSAIVFGEFIIKRKWLDEKKLYQGYAVSTMIVGIVFLVFLSALVSGKGIDLATDVFSLGAWITSAGSILFVLGTLIIGIGLAPVFFDLEAMKNKVLPFIALGIAVSIGAYYLYLPSFLSPLIVIPSILTLLPAILFVSSKKARGFMTNKAIFITFLSIIIFSLQFLICPSLIGRSLSIDSITATGPAVSEYGVLTSVGAVIIGLLLAFYMVVALRQKRIYRETETLGTHGEVKAS
jgi:cytochrome bd ubiquinol oxidase subunit II